MNTIREAREADFSAVHGLLASSELVCEDLAAKDMCNFVVIPATNDAPGLSAVAGLETFPTGEDGLLRSVAVSPSKRGNGIGVSLVAAIEERARGAGIRRLWLLTTTAPEFFRRLGFVETQRIDAPNAVQQSSEFRELCPASAVCMSKLL